MSRGGSHAYARSARRAPGHVERSLFCSAIVKKNTSNLGWGLGFSQYSNRKALANATPVPTPFRFDFRAGVHIAPKFFPPRCAGALCSRVPVNESGAPGGRSDASRSLRRRPPRRPGHRDDGPATAHFDDPRPHRCASPKKPGGAHGPGIGEGRGVLSPDR